MLYIPKLTLTIDGTFHWMMRGTLCQDVRYQIDDIAGPHTYQLLILWTQSVGPLCHLVWCGGPFAVGLISLG